MRFDDSLSTVLAGDTSTASGRDAAWRQLVDLLGRGRGDISLGVTQLAAWRNTVPLPVRAASGRALAFAAPPAALVGLFAADDLTVAGPVLRTAMLTADEWMHLLPGLSPATRAVLRHRRDLPAAVQRGLESFGPTDFVLSHQAEAAPAAAPVYPAAPVKPTPTEKPAEGIPSSVPPPPAPPATTPVREKFEIADLVARIDAFQRTRPEPVSPEPPAEPDEFHYVTDADGVIRWVEGIARGMLIGVSLAHSFRQGTVRLAEETASALRLRLPFGPVALEIEGDEGRAWRLWGTPRFDRAAGRFIGMAGVGRRESATVSPAADQLRQLTHELRTPANAIAGFAELIGTELLGPAPAVYLDRARLIGREAGAVVGAIDDLDTAARLQGGVLAWRAEAIDLAQLAGRAMTELAATAAQRSISLVLDAAPSVMARADGDGVGRLLDRLLRVALAQCGEGERLSLTISGDAREALVSLAAPTLAARPDQQALLTIAAEPERGEGPLLGLAFSLRLAAAVAAALGGTLAASAGCLTLRLPAAHTA